MTKLARSAALVSVILTGAALAAAPAGAAEYRFRNGQFNQNYVDNCPGSAACRPKKPAPVKPLPYFKPPAYVLSGQYKTHPRPTGYIGPHYQSSWGPGYHTNWPGIGLVR